MGDYSIVPKQDTPQKILELIKLKGPSLPIHISKYIGMSTLISGAYLSTLSDEKMIKISNLKVGGSPVYFLPGQEQQLENFFQYLPGKEREAFQLIKNNGVLKDDEQEPAIRVALRSIKDFAIPFHFEQYPNILFWRYFIIPDNEAREKGERIINAMPKEIPEIKPVPEIKVEEKKQEKIEIEPEVKVETGAKKGIENESLKKVPKEKEKIEHGIEIKERLEEAKEKPLIVVNIKEKKDKKKKVNLKFFEEVRNFLLKKDIEFLQELLVDNKEIIGKVRINSDLGKMSFLMIAKDKKRVAESDFITAHQKAMDEKLPCYFLSKADLAKKSFQFLEDYKNLVKADRIV